MDKTLEIVLVATTLVVAAVVVISMLQGQSDSFGGFANDQTSSASCSLGYQQWQQSIECDGGDGTSTTSSQDIVGEYSSNECGWAQGGGPSADEAC